MPQVESSVAARFLGYATTKRGYHVLIAGYSLVLALSIGLLFPGLGKDDADQLLFAQFFDWGYSIANPPLYTWLVLLSVKLFGTTGFAVVAVRQGLLLLMFVLLYRGAFKVLEDERLAALAALSPLAMYYVAWIATLNFTNTVLLMTAITATFLAIIRLDERGGISSYLLLGLLLGVGVLAKYSFALVIVALAAGCFADDRLRRRLLDWRSLVTLAVLAAMVLPHLLWLAEHRADLPELAQARLVLAPPTKRLYGAFVGLADLGDATIQFLLPAAAIAAMFFHRAFLPTPSAAVPSARYRRVLGWFLVVLGVASAIGVVAFGVTRVRTHYMAILILAPIYFFARVQAREVDAAAIRRCAAIFLGLGAVVVVGVYIKLIFEPLRCSKCHRQFPTAVFAEELRRAGFRSGTILTHWYPYRLGGNMRVAFPDSRVISGHYLENPAPPRAERGSCLYVWVPYRNGNPLSSLLHFSDVLFGARPPKNAAIGRIELPMPRSRNRHFILEYVFLKNGLSGCH
jgi:hypothetical protein